MPRLFMAARFGLLNHGSKVKLGGKIHGERDRVLSRNPKLPLLNLGSIFARVGQIRGEIKRGKRSTYPMVGTDGLGLF